MADNPQDNSTPDETDAGSAIGDAIEQLNADEGGADEGDADEGDADDNPDAGKAEDDKGDAAGAPEAYDTSAFQMPEGVEFDQEGFEAIEPVLRDLGLSQDNAAKLMEAYSGKIVPMLTARGEKQLQDAGTKLMADMAKELHADPKVGGVHLEESKALCARAIQASLPDKDERAQFTQFLSETGLGNNRFLMRVLAHAGREMGEATAPSAEGGAGGEKTTVDKFYG